MKRLFWGVADRVGRALNLTLGALWRSTIRPYSGSIEEHLRLARFFFRFQHFDRFGTHCAIGRRARFWGSVRIFIGSYSSLFDDVIISGVGEIHIGDRSTIGHNSVLVSREPIEIGNDVWIGAGTIILRGVNIGNGAVVAGNGVVVAGAPPHSVVGSVPAKSVQYRQVSAESLEARAVR